MNAVNLAVTRPVNDWCADGSFASDPPDPLLCEDKGLPYYPPGPAVAESWDDWGPFYTPMYAQHIGLDGSTVEMCSSTGNWLRPGSDAAVHPGPPGLLPGPVHGLVLDARVRGRAPERDAQRRSRAVPPRRRRRASGRLLRAAVRRRQQLDEGVPRRVRDPGRQRPAVRRRGQAPRRLAASQRHQGGHAARRRLIRRPDVRQGLLRRLDGPGPPRARRHGAEHRHRRLRQDPHPLRASGGVEPRLPVGRRHRRDPARLGLLAGDDRDQEDDDASRAASSPVVPTPTPSSSTRRPQSGRSTH